MEPLPSALVCYGVLLAGGAVTVAAIGIASCVRKARARRASAREASSPGYPTGE